ncbi:MAG TPA: deoxyribodipyrimidine photo-lyase [Steroidobacteraceae bacterium]|nr:deoxyribodipyrimidine photo-lyase [Steroidobacteraceae bacterium]
MRTIVWYRGKDLRVADHEPLRAAAAAGDVIPLFVLDDHFFAPAAARRTPFRIQFLLDSLKSLAANLEHLGSKLVVVDGRSVEQVPRLAKLWKADRVVAQSWVAPVGRARDRAVAKALPVPLELFDTETLTRPGSLRTGAGDPFSVFTAFARAFARDVKVPAPLAAPKKLPPLPDDVRTRSLAIPDPEALGLVRNPRVQEGGERAARARLKGWLAGDAKDYDELRNRMDLPGTSRLSADLKFGTLSARTVWHAVQQRLADLSPDALRVYHNELLWREFAHSTLFDRPKLLDETFRPEWRGFPWRDDEAGWRAWVDGKTGYPVVDAAARELLATGFVHNRARMIAASFLAKHLLIDFRRGERHYFDLLTDGDWANNDAGWQWSAGCGCDAQPWFRIFNPVTQGEKFDPDGTYVRTWVPELAKLDTKYLHAPWTAPPALLAAAGLRLGADYPRPVVEHDVARRRFLEVAKQHLDGARSKP